MAYRTLAMVGPETVSRRARAALRVLQEEGYVLSGDHVGQPDATVVHHQELPIETVLALGGGCFPEGFRRVGINCLGDCRGRSALAVWRAAAAASPYHAPISPRLWKAMETCGYQLDLYGPHTFNARTVKDWRGHGANPLTAGQLVKHGIWDTRLLAAILPHELQKCTGMASGKRYKEVLAIRARLAA